MARRCGMELWLGLLLVAASAFGSGVSLTLGIIRLRQK